MEIWCTFTASERDFETPKLIDWAMGALVT